MRNQRPTNASVTLRRRRDAFESRPIDAGAFRKNASTRKPFQRKKMLVAVVKSKYMIPAIIDSSPEATVSGFKRKNGVEPTLVSGMPRNRELGTSKPITRTMTSAK